MSGAVGPGRRALRAGDPARVAPRSRRPAPGWAYACPLVEVLDDEPADTGRRRIRLPDGTETSVDGVHLVHPETWEQWQTSSSRAGSGRVRRPLDGAVELPLPFDEEV